MATAQQKWFAYQANRNLSRSGGESESFSALALAAFAIFESEGDGLTDAEKTLMAIYIDAEANNHTLKDYETIYPLSGANGLVDYIGALTAEAFNNPTHSISGYALDGIDQYIDTKYGSLGFVNVSQNNITFGGFTKDFTGIADNGHILTQLGNNNFISAQTGTPRFRGRTMGVGSYNTSNYAATTEQHIMFTRVDASTKTYTLNGTTGGNTAEASTAPSVAFCTVAKNGAVFQPLTQSTVCFAAAVGFDQSAHNTNLMTLLTGLGTI